MDHGRGFRSKKNDTKKRKKKEKKNICQIKQ